MKVKYKKFLIVCGKVFMLVCLAAFALLCVFYYFSPKDEAQAIRASAEAAAPTAETAPIVYPSENLFDISKVVERSYLKATDTTVTVTNYYAANTGVLLRTFCPKIVAGTYTFSATITSSVPLSNAAASVSLVSSSGVLIQLIRQSKLGYVTNTVTLAEEQLNMSLYFYGVGEGVVSWEKITCNAGETAYPWLPNFDSIRQEGYEDGESAGHEAGKQEGYEEGYKDASDTLNLGVLYGATVSGKFSYTNGQTLTLASGKPDFSYNGLNFNSIWGKYYSYNGDTENTLESVEMTLNFKTPFQYDGFPLYFLGDSDVMSATFISTANKRYNANIEKYNDTAIGEDYALIRIRENEKEDGIEVKALTIYFGRATDTLYNANVLSKSGGYLNGYDNGYNEGFSHGKTEGHIEGREEGKEEGYNNGYNEGLSNGKTEGKNEGYNKGYNEGYIKGKSDGFSQEPISKSIRGFVFSLFDAPVSSFLSAFNLSYDGFDIGALVAFIFTGIVVIAVVRLLT